MFNSTLYSGAVIRLATLQKKKEQASHLLFATVTLIARGRPLPPPMKEPLHRCAVGKTGETVFFRRTLLTVKDAIDWYRGLGFGNDLTPIPSKTEERNSHCDGRKIETGNLTDNPPWPVLGLPMEEGMFTFQSARSHPAPFLGNSPARIHRRFGSQDGFDTVLADDEALAFVARRLHIDLRLYREYLGSVVLVAPDPVLKQIDNFMIPATADKGERIFYRFVPRAGASLEDLKLTTFEEQTHLLNDFSTYDIPLNGILDIEKGDCIGTYGYVVSHFEYGILAYSPPYPFLRQIELKMNPMLDGGLTVSVPISESTNSPRMEYQAARGSSSLSSRSLIGDPARSADITSRIVSAATYREKINNAKLYGQRWFSEGSREEAMRFIQEELKNSKHRVIIADPYLASLQLGQFLYAVNPDSVSVTLLTSGLAFKNIKQRSSKGRFWKNIKKKLGFYSEKYEPSKLDDFSDRLAKLEKNVKVVAKTYVLQSSILHDRFLVIDNVVWFLGNSLNTLGDKASLIVKLPNSDEVICQLEAMVKQALPFENYIQRQALQQKGSAS